ncbi:uncharacterized protein [Phyllobates terribilis]|uniref:uncharacterized protein n=1 Tax=Phyllobates terribilis TaxID=111132 RepID=UPI003CCAE8D1
MDIQKKMRSILDWALENISKESLKRFKRDLSSLSGLTGSTGISLSTLEEKTATEVVDLIIRYYTIEEGPRITVKVLKKINERQASVNLQKEIAEVFVKKLRVEKTPAKGSAVMLRDATNRTSSRLHRSQHRGQQYGKENFLNFEDSSQSSDDYPRPKSTQINARRSLTMSEAENEGQASKKTRGSSPSSHSGRRYQPDIQLVKLTNNDIKIMAENHEGKAYRFACLLFKHFVPFHTYKMWTKTTNFDGTGGKYALPSNLRDIILKEVRRKFSLKQKDKRLIKNAINELLRKPRQSGWSKPI